jgi:hypothetical protein
MLANEIVDVIYNEHYANKVSEMFNATLQFHMTNALSRIEMMILMEADVVTKAGGDAEPLYNVVRRIRETFIAQSQQQQQTESTEQKATPKVETTEVVTQPTTASIHAFPKVDS